MSQQSKLSFSEILALGPEEYEAYSQWLEDQKSIEEQAQEQEDLRLLNDDPVGTARY